MPDLGHRLLLQQFEQTYLVLLIQTRAPGQVLVDIDIADIEIDVTDAGNFEGFQHQVQDLHVGLDAGMPVKFGAHLQRAAAAAKTV